MRDSSPKYRRRRRPRPARRPQADRRRAARQAPPDRARAKARPRQAYKCRDIRCPHPRAAACCPRRPRPRGSARLRLLFWAKAPDCRRPTQAGRPPSPRSPRAGRRAGRGQAKGKDFVSWKVPPRMVSVSLDGREENFVPKIFTKSRGNGLDIPKKRWYFDLS